MEFLLSMDMMLRMLWALISQLHIATLQHYDLFGCCLDSRHLPPVSVPGCNTAKRGQG